MLDIMLPTGGNVMIQVEAYFDESGSHDGAPVLCVAGYLMKKAQAVALNEAWNMELAKYELPYFHMVDCAHGAGEFQKLTMDERISLETAMIAIIKQLTIQGIAVSVNEAEYSDFRLARRHLGTAYTASAFCMLASVSSWLDANDNVTDVSYFFEAGHRSQKESNAVMNFVFSNPRLHAQSRYAGHAFVDKRRVPAIQAADLLAWQWYTDIKHATAGRKRRKDCASLLEHPHVGIHFGKDELAELVAAMAPFSPPGALPFLP